MSKKRQKKMARRVRPSSPTTMRSMENKSTTSLAEVKKPVAVVKTYYTAEELNLRYAYVRSDLKRIALIAVPMILALYVLSWFVKI